MEDKNIVVQDAKVTESNAADSKQIGTTGQSQEEVSTPKTFTLDEFNNAMSAVKKNTEEKVLKKFKDVDIEKYRDLVTKEEQMRIEEQKKRGEFERVLKETAEKKDLQIQQLRATLNSVKVDGSVLNAASKYKAISPEQVSKLVKDKIRLNDNGDVEVVGDTGAPRYTESGDPMSVDEFISEWLQQNPHFVQSGPSGSGAKSNTKPASLGTVDISALDIANNPEHKRIYAEYRRQKYAPGRRI
jgi:hypothetical protein